MPDESHPLTDDEQAWLDDLLGRGAGDPDVFGIPGDTVLLPAKNKQLIDLSRGWYTYPLNEEMFGTTNDLNKLKLSI